MDVNILAFTIIVVIVLVLYACMRASSLAGIAEENMKKGTAKDTLERKIRVIKAYFFDDKGKLDFRKFCDYVLCIRSDENGSKYIEYIAEIELLILSCDGLKDTLFNQLLEDKAIIAIVGTEKEFQMLQDYIRDGKFKGTYGDFCYILFSTIFYLKNKLRSNEQK